MNTLRFERLATQLWRVFILLCLFVVTSIPHIRAQSAAADGTFQDFDTVGTGTPYVLNTGSPVPAAVISGGPTGAGNMLRLATGSLPVHQNSIAFDRTASGVFDQIVADFDFRMSPGTGRADGFGFALLNTANYGPTGAVAPQNVAEEPNFAGSLGVGFDIHQAGAPAEISNNHLSIHFNGALLQEFDVTLALDLNLAGSRWIHARIIMRPGGGYSDVTVILTQCSGPANTVINQFTIPGFTPYEGRVHFAARSGGLTADHDIDNVRVNFLSLEQSVIGFSNGCYSAVETDGSRLLTITRTGNVNETASVHYATTNLSATAPSDYKAISGTLTFNAGQTTKTLSVPIVNNSNPEPDESFLVSLSDPSTDTSLGGPAVAKVTIVDDETAQQKGHWSEVIPSQVVPIHMHLLPTGQVLYWDRHDDVKGWDGNPRLWDPATGMISMAEMTMYDLFCSGHSFMADGRLLVTGGHIDDGVGEDKASIYDPFTDSWTSLLNMNAGRWYPSNVTLANGDVLVMAGSITEGNVNPLPQVWQAANGVWRNLINAQITAPPFADYYPFLYLAPNGKVFNAGPQKNTYYLVTSGTGNWTYVDDSSLDYRDYGSSVMYDDGKVLIVGGNPHDPYNPDDPDDLPTIMPTTSAEVINLNDANPEWDSTIDPMHFARRQLNTTLLPDGKVLVTGGSSVPGFDESSGAVLAAEIWNPATETWTVMAAQTRYRGYHSTALLLPDGRVLVGGGGHPDPDSGAEYNFEIYSPPYLFKGAQPTITNAPAYVGYGQEFFVQIPNAATITQMTLVRLSSVTHSFNQNQRFKRLDFVLAPGGLTATMPANPNLLPPGHYLLFILNGDGVPSVARIIRIGTDQAPHILSIIRADSSPTSVSNVDFTVAFSESGTGVSTTTPYNDFDLTTAGVTGASIISVNGSGSAYTVTVNTGTGNGTIRLGVPVSATITDLAGNPLINLPFTSGQIYTINKPPIPKAPILRSPRTNTITIDTTPTFWWTNVAGGQTYEIVFATDIAFTTNVASHTVNGSPYTAAPPFTDGKYFWRVRAYNAENQPGKWSSSRILTIDTTPPSIPVPSSPADNTSTSRSPMFKWLKVPTAVSYQFQYDNNSNFASPTYNVTVRGNFRRPPAMNAGIYYWRVRAKDAAGNWSAWFTPFKITINP